jgi:hypothetical protein
MVTREDGFHFSKFEPFGQLRRTITAHFRSRSGGAPRVTAQLRHRPIVKDHHVQPRKPPIARKSHHSRSSMKAPKKNTPSMMTTAGMFIQSQPTSNARQTVNGCAVMFTVEEEGFSFMSEATQRLRKLTRASANTKLYIQQSKLRNKLASLASNDRLCEKSDKLIK